MKNYKNISKKTLALEGFGFIKPDQIIKSDKIINNANFEEVVGEQKPQIKKDNK